MTGRKLKRQLNLPQVVMLGTAGAIGAEIFVLTGHAAGLSGPAFVLALVLGGLLSYSIALNYSELASTFPETGGAMTYVREAWGRNLLSFLVGSLDCLSSTFYAALSAVGFAYSLRILVPSLPIIPTAIAIILVFVVLNILGVGTIGNVQIVLGGFLLSVLTVYIVLGLALPGGFDRDIYLSGGGIFIHETVLDNFAAILSSIALAYVAFIGFEVIADDAKEIKNPDRNIPLGILLSLTLLIVIYPLIALVTLGTVNWQELAGSETALTDAAVRFLPVWGPPVLAVTGIVATVTTLNTSMLSATREAFTLGRDGMWPRAFCRVGRFRTPYFATLVIGAIISAVAAIGLVDFLSYISSSGYLFVLFWSNLALIRLRKRYPHQRRPFRTPLFPLTVYLAMGACALIIAFSDPRALAFGAGLLASLSLAYALAPFVRRGFANRALTVEKSRDRILVAVANPATGARLVHLAAILAQASEDTTLCVFHVVRPVKETPAPAGQAPLRGRLIPHTGLPAEILQEAHRRNVPLYTKTRESESISAGILDEIEDQQNIKLVLAGWPGPLDASAESSNPVPTLLEKAPTNLAVLLSQKPGRIRNILVPVGGGLHSRLALRVAFEIADQENARITALHIFPGKLEAEEIEDQLLFLREIVEDELGAIPARLAARVVSAESISSCILEQTRQEKVDLLVMGASEEYGSGTRLFGSVDDWIVEHIKDCSVLLVRQHETVPMHWIRRRMKKFDQDARG